VKAPLNFSSFFDYIRRMKGYLHLVFLMVALASCSAVRDLPKYQLANDVYEFRQAGTAYSKVLVELEEDTVRIYDLQGKPITSLKPSGDEYFRQRSFDVDVMTVAFRYRPPQAGVPAQLSTNFNGNVFLGYRVDRFKLDFRSTPVGVKKTLTHRAITAGVFTGFGSTPLNPTTTRTGIATEYDGLIITRGAALMIGINQLTVGAGLGWDFLTGPDKNKWIYQNKPWLGLTLGLNLN
jgi:hypothetical protein